MEQRATPHKTLEHGAMKRREEPKSGRYLVIALMLAFILLSLAVAAYYYTFHGYKKQRPAVAPSAVVLMLNQVSS
jgi:flagellar basal body-associated protein FliL